MTPTRQLLGTVVLVGLLLLAYSSLPVFSSQDRNLSAGPPPRGTVPGGGTVFDHPTGAVPTPPSLGPGVAFRSPSAVTPRGGGTPWTGGPTAQGVEYSGSSAIASDVGVNIRVPDDLPAATDLYYVALSVFDGAESYDQVGLANDNGSWQVYYGAASTCDTRPDAHWDAFALTRDATYRFEISIGTGGQVNFEAFDRSGNSVWQETAHTGATYLELDSTMLCGSLTLPGYTETQEVYAAALTSPPYNFVLTNSTQDGAPESEWLGLPGSVDPSATVRNGSNVTIFNQPFTASFGASGDQRSMETTDLPQSLRFAVEVSVDGPTTYPLAVQNYTAPPGWAFSESPSRANGSFRSNISLALPAGVAPGVYVVGMQAVNASGLPNRIAFVLTILNRLVLSVVGSPASGAIDANETATFDPNATGGLPGYSYLWARQPTGCTVIASIASCRFATAGNYSLDVGVMDALHYLWYENETYSVLRDPQLTAATDVTSVGLGGTLGLTVAIVGGLAPYTLVWQGLPPGCTTVNGTSLLCLPVASGQYSVMVTLSDGTGFRTTLPLPVTVVPPSHAATVPLETVGLAVVGAGLLVLIAACTLLLVRRRRAP